MCTGGPMQEGGIYTTDADIQPTRNPTNTKQSVMTCPILALDRAHLGSRLHRSRGQSSVLESWRSLGSPQLLGPSFPANESPPTANRRVHWWGFTTLQDSSRRILPPVRLGASTEKSANTVCVPWVLAAVAVAVWKRLR